MIPKPRRSRNTVKNTNDTTRLRAGGIPECPPPSPDGASCEGEGDGDGDLKLAKNGPAEARELADKMLGKALVTHQTGPEGQLVRRVYIEQGLDIGRELYLALVLDRDARRVAVMASTEGGMDVEEVAEH